MSLEPFADRPGRARSREAGGSQGEPGRAVGIAAFRLPVLRRPRRALSEIFTAGRRRRPQAAPNACIVLELRHMTLSVRSCATTSAAWHVLRHILRIGCGMAGAVAERPGVACKAFRNVTQVSRKPRASRTELCRRPCASQPQALRKPGRVSREPDACLARVSLRPAASLARASLRPAASPGASRTELRRMSGASQPEACREADAISS
jgi:hypothetical protein